jgi:hypothetical protein
MNSTALTRLLELAALLHLGLICAGASMPKAVDLSRNLNLLSPFVRRLFLVYYAFIGFMLLGFGLLTFVFAAPMAAGEPVARGLCFLLTVFWLLRLIAATFVFDVRPYLTNVWYRIGYQATNVVFVYLLTVYAFTAWKGGRL